MSIQASELQPGDIMMKLYFGGLLHNMIVLGQALHHAPNAKENFVHAAIYIGNGMIAESIGEGITVTKLLSQGHPYEYNVYRYADTALAGVAAAVAEGWIAVRRGAQPDYTPSGRFGRYAAGGAAGAAVQNIFSQPDYQGGEDLWGSGGKPGIGSTYCSQFVAAAYQAAGATASPPQVPIRIAQARATPQLLHDTLMGEPQWSLLGRITVH